MSAEQSHEGEIARAPVPVAEPVRPVASRSRVMVAVPIPRSPVTAAAGGLTAGALFVTLVRILSRRGLPRSRQRRRPSQRSVVASRSFLVDVHMLGR